MPEFKTLPEAFEWFLENIYPNLPTEQKTSSLRRVKHAYYKQDEKVSEKRMRRVLEEYSNYQITHTVEAKEEN